MQLKPKPSQEPNPDELEDFIREAGEVKTLTQQAGWGILERDLTLYRDEISRRIAYVNPKRPEFDEIRILFLAADKIISMVNDYQENRDRAIELLEKMQNPELAITMDVDNEI